MVTVFSFGHCKSIMGLLPSLALHHIISFSHLAWGHILRSFRHLTFAVTALLCSCTAIRNDLDKGLAYGTESDALTRKVDEKKLPGQSRSKINAYIWRASLSAVQSFPLVTSDPQHGVIATDWYSAPENPDDRKRITIEILGSEVRRDLLRVSVLRQLKQGGEWVEAPSPAGIEQKMEDTIIFNAKELRHW